MWMLVVAPLAFADVVEPGYVETCTAKVCGDAKAFECSAWHGERDACTKTAPAGYTKACQTRGASAWSEVWCPPGVTPKQDAAVTPKSGPCGTVPLGASSFLVGIGLLTLLGRRRA